MKEHSWKESIIEVLSESGKALHYTEIAEAIVERKLKTDVGATPANTINATVTISIQNEGEKSPFIRVDRGYIALRGKIFQSEPKTQSDVMDDDAGLINAFGMYWSRDKVLWSASNPRLLGQQQAGSEPVDFSSQKGVYLLHDGRQVVYVGRTTDQPLGIRLKQHITDRLNGRWDRFSWFGIYPVKPDGTISTSFNETFTLEKLIVTMEALLIEGLEPPQNRKRGDDFRAVEYIQIMDPKFQERKIEQIVEDLKNKLL
jgi:hypothetical protein